MATTSTRFGSVRCTGRFSACILFSGLGSGAPVTPTTPLKWVIGYLPLQEVFTPLYTHCSVNQIQRCRTTHRSERDRRHRDSNVPNSRCKGVCQRSCQCIHSDTLRYKAHERWRRGEFMACPRSQKWFPTLRSRSFQTPAASRLGSRLVEVSRRDLIVLVVVPLRSAIFSSWRLIPPRTWSGAWAA